MCVNNAPQTQKNNNLGGMFNFMDIGNNNVPQNNNMNNSNNINEVFKNKDISIFSSLNKNNNVYEGFC